MKKSTRFITLGLGLALGTTLLSGCALKMNVTEVGAWSGSECTATWYIVGTINGQNWNSWNQFTLNGNRYEYTFEDTTQVEFKLKNANSWDSGIEINADYGPDLDWAGKGWTALTTSNGGNFKTKAAGKYTVYYDKNIATYENGVWAFGIEEYQEPQPESNASHKYNFICSKAGWGSIGSFENDTLTVALGVGDEMVLMEDDTNKYFISIFADPTGYFHTLNNPDYPNIVAEKQGFYTFTMPADFYSTHTGITFTYVESAVDHVFGLVGKGNWGSADFATFVGNTCTVELDSGDEFKFRADGSWDHVYSDNAISNMGDYFAVKPLPYNNVVAIKTGTYTFTLPENFYETGTGITFTYSGDDVMPAHTIGIIGLSNWEADVATFVNNTLEVEMTQGQQFKFRADGQWSKNWSIEALAQPGECFGSGDSTTNPDGNIVVNKTGTYIFTMPSTFYFSERGITYVEKGAPSPDVPAEPGYYLTSSKLDFKFEGAYKMETENIGEGNIAEYYQYEGTDGEKLLIRMWYAENDTAYGHFVANEYSVGLGEADQDGNFEFAKDCTINVFAKWEDDQLHFYVAEADQVTQQAAAFAKAFNTAISGVCKWDNTTDPVALAQAWQAQKTDFNALVEAVQNVLKDATKEHRVADIAEFIEKYEMVAGRYGDALGEGYNFLGKTLPASAIITISNNNTTTPIMIIVIASIALLSVASVVTIVIVKRRFVR